jgi:DNA-binding NarL/FixJ family response regulator
MIWETSTPLAFNFSQYHLLPAPRLEACSHEITREDITISIVLDAPSGCALHYLERYGQPHPTVIITNNPCFAYLDDLQDKKPRALLINPKSQLEIEQAIEAIIRGGFFRNSSQNFLKLTERERRVLRLLADTLDDTAIAGRLNISVGRVRNVVSDIFGKLRPMIYPIALKNRVQLSQWYYGNWHLLAQPHVSPHLNRNLLES